MDEMARLNRGLKTRTPISNTLRNDLLASLKQISEDTDVPMSKLLDRAVDMLVKSYHEKQKL